MPPLGVWSADKLLHAAGFAALGYLGARALGRGSWVTRRWAVVVGATLIASLWGALDEVHQLVTPNRSSDWRDWLADTGGGLLGALVQQAVALARAARRPPDAGRADGGARDVTS